MKGPKLFNALLKVLRSQDGEYSAFKQLLDEYLSQILDQPKVDDLTSTCTDINTAEASNSVIDWLRMLETENWTPKFKPGKAGTKTTNTAERESTQSSQVGDRSLVSSDTEQNQ